MTTIAKPYLLFLGDAPDDLAAKTAIGVHQWRPDDCVGQIRLNGCNARLDLDDMTIAEGVAAGAKTLLLGIANRGGVIPDSWLPTLVEALEQGLDIASGLHTKISDIEQIKTCADRNQRQLHEVRHPDGEFRVASGEVRSGKRLLAVGTDCSVGKMYTTLAIEQELSGRGVAADFRATGQTGILIDGRGVSVDAVVADFISGAVEDLCPAADDDHWDVIEGQGSLFHPSYAGVTLGLIHGAQARSLVLCHEPTREHMRGLPHQQLPDLRRCIDANLEAARVVSDNVSFAGIAINTAALDEDASKQLLDRTADQFGLPCVDPVRTGVAAIVDQLET